MKRLMTLLLAAGLVLGATSAAKAVDFKMTGLWQNRVSFADRNFEKHNGDDKMRAATRLRTQIDVIASESLKGVMFFEIGHQNWGKAAEGAALGTDGKEIKVRYSYVDWIIPQTDAKVRMGLQPYVQPTFTGIGSPILDADGAGITISNQFTENVSASLFWLRAENDNDPEMTKHDAHEAEREQVEGDHTENVRRNVLPAGGGGHPDQIKVDQHEPDEATYKGGRKQQLLEQRHLGTD